VCRSCLSAWCSGYRSLTTPGLAGAWNFDTVPGLAKVAKEIARQSMMIGYLNAFMMYTVTSSGLAVVFVLMVRRRRAA
jgi:DHA2 family multidrug resistance protein